MNQDYDRAVISLCDLIVETAWLIRTGGAETSNVPALWSENGLLNERAIARLLEQAADYIVSDILGRDDGDASVVKAVTEVLRAGGPALSGAGALEADARFIRQRLADAEANALLENPDQDGEPFRRLFSDSCAYVSALVSIFPAFSPVELSNFIAQQDLFRQHAKRIVAEAPVTLGDDDLATDYQRDIINKYDRSQIWGVSRPSRMFPLDVSHVSLSAPDQPSLRGRRPENAIGEDRRILITGEAGTGKTTLLRWLAVGCARGVLPGPLSDWNGCQPYLLSLRDHSADELRRLPDLLLGDFGKQHSSAIPDGWLPSQLGTGQAVVLLDGADEIPKGLPREEFAAALRALVDEYPQVVFVITARAAPGSSSWPGPLADDLQFRKLEILPLSRYDVRSFIRHWHLAARKAVEDAAEWNRLEKHEASLIAAVDRDPHLAALAVNPLLCSLLCALNRSRDDDLPTERMFVYEKALDLLLSGWDAWQGRKSQPLLSVPRQIIVLQDLALWLMSQPAADADFAEAAEQVAKTVRAVLRRRADDPPGKILRAIMECSTLLHEPAIGRIAFTHKVFQDYLAGRAAIDVFRTDELIEKADDDCWRDVIIMAAGHAQNSQRDHIIRGLLDEGETANEQLLLLALACDRAAPYLSEPLQLKVEQAVKGLLPPTTYDRAEQIALAGDFIIPLLGYPGPGNQEERWATIRAASRIASSEALGLISSLARSATDEEFLRELRRAWRFFEPKAYAADVLASLAVRLVHLEVDDPDLVPVLKELPDLTSVSLTVPEQYPGARPAVDLTSLQDIQRLSTLKLDLGGTIPSLEFLASCDQLAVLRLSNMGLREDLGVLGRRPAKVRHLVIDNMDSLRSLDGLAEWNELESLLLSGCPRIEDLAEISKLEHLQHLALHEVGPVQLEALSGLHRLRSLTLSGMDEIDLTPLVGMGNDLRIYLPAGTAFKGERYAAKGLRTGKGLKVTWV